MIWELGFPQEYPTPIYDDKYPTIDIVNSSIPTERNRHIYVRFFAIQFSKEDSYIITHHIPGITNTADAFTKPFGWVLHYRHA